MTTGSYYTGPFPNGGSTKFHYAKSWTGGDGKTITGRVTTKPKWNAYRMSSSTFKSSNPNRVGLLSDVTEIYEVRLNHSWVNIAGSDPVAFGYSTFGNGSISDTFPASQFAAMWTAQEELKLLAKIINKVRGHSFDLGVSLAEVDKLAGTVLGTVKNLVGGVKDLSRGRFAQFARRFSARPPGTRRVKRLVPLDISGRFLEMRYAWEPAIQDVFGAVEAFEAISRGPRQAYFRTSSRKSKQVKWVTNYCAPHQRVTVRRSYLFEMYEEMAFARQLGLTNPATVAWERVPWSFVFDWFMPIGTYLSNLGQLPHMKGRWCRTSSLRVNCSGSFPAVKVGFSPMQPFPTCDFERFFLERNITSSPPAVPFPNFRVQGAVEGKRIQNALALAHQVLFKHEAKLR